MQLIIKKYIEYELYSLKRNNTNCGQIQITSKNKKINSCFVVICSIKVLILVNLFKKYFNNLSNSIIIKNCNTIATKDKFMLPVMFSKEVLKINDVNK